MALRIKHTGQRIMTSVVDDTLKTVEAPIHAKVLVTKRTRRLTEQQLSNIRFNLMIDAEKRAARYLEARAKRNK